jgi:hypothetical protein
MTLPSKGYVEIDNFFELNELDKLEGAIIKLFLSQAKKIGEYRDLALSLSKDKNITNKDKLVSLYEAMEEADKKALYQVQNFFPSSQIIRRIFSENFLTKCSELTNVNDVELLLVEGPALFVNRPNTERLLYKWHSEVHAYPKRRNFINVWFPIFGDKTLNNGTMSFKVDSHKRDFPFSKYSGFNKDTENKSNNITQWEIPSQLLTEYDEHFCQIKRGGCVFFDKSLVHRSNNNPSNDYSFAIVARVWEHSNDLTISGSMAGDIGRANLYVEDVV